MATIIGVLTLKGGTGKSTITTNLARALQDEGRVRIADADPQGTARRWANAQEGSDQPDVATPSMPLDRSLRSLADDVDFLLVDGAAKSKERTAQVVRVADALLIPVRPSGADLWASEWLVKAVKERRKAEGKPAAAFVVSQQRARTNLSREIGDVLEGYGLPVLEGRTSQRVAYAEALSVGSTVLDTEPTGKAADEIRQIAADTLELIQQAS